MMRGTVLTIYLLTVVLLISVGILGTSYWGAVQRNKEWETDNRELEGQANMYKGAAATCQADLARERESSATCTTELATAVAAFQQCQADLGIVTGQLKYEREAADARRKSEEERAARAAPPPATGAGGKVEAPPPARQATSPAALLLLLSTALGTFTIGAGSGVLLARRALR